VLGEGNGNVYERERDRLIDRERERERRQGKARLETPLVISNTYNSTPTEHSLIHSRTHTISVHVFLFILRRKELYLEGGVIIATPRILVVGQ
jgi:hypothetical protein